MELFLFLLGMVALLLLKGFFSGSEIALVNADKLTLSAQANQGHAGSRRVLRLFRNPEVLLGTTLVGTNISTVSLTTLGTVLMIEYFGEAGDLYAFMVLTPLLLVLGEIVPKSVFQQKSNQVAPVIVYPLQAFSMLLYPVVFIFSRVARVAARLTGAGSTQPALSVSREQIRLVVDMSERAAGVDAFDRDRIRRVTRFAETTVGEAMIPIAEMTAISERMTTAEAVQLVRRHGFNRLPVFHEKHSNVIGVATLTTWDLMNADLDQATLADLTHEPLYVSAYQTIDELLPVLRGREDHMAIVVDEFGSATGMITMEDILEEVVGEIDVGYDFEEYLPRRNKRIYEMLDEETFLMDSRLPLSEVNDALGVDLQTKESHTLGGLVIARLRHIPKPGEFIVEAGYQFIVTEATDRAITKLRVEPVRGEIKAVQDPPNNEGGS